MTCPQCQSGEMQRRWSFHHRSWLVISGAVILGVSLALGTEGWSALHYGVSNPHHREGPEPAALGGMVLCVLSLMGLGSGLTLMRGQRIWRCGACGFAGKNP
jgi:hypothetical protein